MKKTHVILSALVFIAALALAAPLFAEDAAPVENLAIRTKSGQLHEFKVEIADTPEKSELGLMYRKSMARDHGMLFELGRPQYAVFWMKNTLIPLDILYVGAAGDIVSIAADATPLSLAPIPAGGPVVAAIELNGGEAAKRGIRPGDKVIHPYFKAP